MVWGCRASCGDILAGDATSYIQPQSLLNSSGCEGACVFRAPLSNPRKVQLKNKTNIKLPLIGILLQVQKQVLQPGSLCKYSHSALTLALKTHICSNLTDVLRKDLNITQISYPFICNSVCKKQQRNTEKCTQLNGATFTKCTHLKQLTAPSVHIRTPCRPHLGLQLPVWFPMIDLEGW